MIQINIDQKRLNKKKGDYATGKAVNLSDGSFHYQAQEIKRKLSSGMRALAGTDINKLPKATDLYVTRKYDGEFALIGFDGEKAISVNPGGTVRTGLPCLQEAEKLLRKAGIRSCLLVGEYYFRDEVSESLRVHQTVRILRSPDSAAELNRIGLAFFDVVEYEDGEKPTSTKDTFRLLEKWLGKGKLAHPAEHIVTDKIDDIYEKFVEWVVDKGSEGIIVRSDKIGSYKIKARHNIDVAIIGYSEGVDHRKGMLHDLLVAVVRKDGTFHELARVGGGFSDDDRRKFVKDLKKRKAPSDYVAVNNDYVAYEMTEPGPVIEISCLDLISERARGGPVNRMVLEWDESRYIALSRMPLVSVISPQFVRIRDDKEAGPEDTPIRQITELTNVSQVEEPADPSAQKPSEMLEREVYVKEMKGNTMVRKLLLWKTNKEQTGEFPAYVVYLTDFSPNRKTPLEREIRIAGSKAAAERMYQEMAKASFVGGWEKA
jgi:ATP-dependent DNA ligase